MWDWLPSLLELRGRGVPAASSPSCGARARRPRRPGARMAVLGDGSIQGTIGGGHLEQLVIADALATLASGEARMHRYPLGATAGQCCGGVVEVFVEALNLGPNLYLFGVGHVGQAVCRALSGTPFVVHAIDERPSGRPRCQPRSSATPCRGTSSWPRRRGAPSEPTWPS